MLALINTKYYILYSTRDGTVPCSGTFNKIIKYNVLPLLILQKNPGILE